MRTEWVVLLRFIHVVGGILWAGAVLTLTWFVAPAVMRNGPAGGRVMQDIMTKGRLPTWLGASAGLTMLSGFVLYGRNTSISNGTWAGSRFGIVIGIGAVSAVVAMILGSINGRRTQKGMDEIAARAAQLGEEAAAAERAKLFQRSVMIGRIVAGLLLVAATAMAVARYL
jgi:hypothetical protein